ncbi:ATPase SWSAP1 [Chanos chanos]|uniref:ATPase SWSAP1 n=1 Tax=Chanos chanos TaxID=29144 RepID=A0A6J2WLN7_CHACN|nr:ATPase SWSAP1-like [Chanos chanos]
MVDILRFIFSRFGPQPVPASFTLSSATESNVLVVSEGSTGTSLLFLTAVTAAAELGLKVIFFTHNAFQKFPVCLQSIPNLNPDSLKRIRFVYSKTLDELLHDVASLHELLAKAAAPPSLLVVDGLERYLREAGTRSTPLKGDRSAAAHLAALLHDTATFFTQNHAPCRVMASFRLNQDSRETSCPDPLLAVLDRYLQVRCTLTQERRGLPAEAEEQAVWQVFLSGLGIRTGPVDAVSHWSLGIGPNGAMQFSPAISPEEHPETQQTVSV